VHTAGVQEAAMADLYRKLCEILDGHAEAYEEICDLLRHQREVLKENDLKGLERLLRRQQDIILEVAGTEERRREVQSELADRLGIDRNLDPPLEELVRIEDIPDAYRRRLVSSRERVVQLTDEAKRLNAQNRALVRQALSFISYSIDGIRDLAEGGRTYGDGGRSDGDADALMMDRRY